MRNVFEFLSLPFVQRAFIAGVLTAISGSLVGVPVVMRKMAFFGDGIAHVTFASIAIALCFDLPILPVAIGIAVIVALALGYFVRKGVSEDTGIGVLFSSAMAFGIVAFSLMQEQRSLMSYLFGDILAVRNQDLFFMSTITGVIVVFTFLLGDKLVYMSYDEEFVKAMGVKVDLIYYVFLVLLSVTIVSSVKILGIVLVAAMLVIPAASSLLVLKSYRFSFILSPVIACVSVFTGIVFSYIFDVPAGALIVLVQSGIFFGILILKRS